MSLIVPILLNCLLVLCVYMADKHTPIKRLSYMAKQARIGGLGIFITKKTMDAVTYAYENGENILTMTKKSKGE